MEREKVFLRRRTRMAKEAYSFKRGLREAAGR
jgi:hypothetical protein